MDIEKNDDVMVSILTLAYNHEPYIRQCLDGIVMQRTNFRFELLIHDDASTDETANIIREYEKKYPDIIKPIYQKENQYSKKVPIGATYLYPKAKGKYIALCEGDDYWTDALKLQKQVDFLESHPDYVMCSHRFRIYIQEQGRFEDDWHNELLEGVNYDLNTLIHGNWYFHPLSVMFRFKKLDLQEYSKYPYSMDAVLFFHLLKKGKGYMFIEKQAVYRIHNGGIWSGIDSMSQMKNEFKARIGLFTVEQSYEAAFFLRNQFTKLISRKWMLKEWKMMLKTFCIISKYFGIVSTLNLYMRKILLNTNLKYN